MTAEPTRSLCSVVTSIGSSKNIIFDLRHVKTPEHQCIAQLEKEFSECPYLNKLYVIKRNGDLLVSTNCLRFQHDCLSVIILRM